MSAGDLLEGRYELEAQLGAGGTARVYRARDLVTKATVAIKLMEAGREKDPEAVAYFSQEGRLAARIRDPHLVPALHFGVDEDRHFIVYDYLPGTSPLSELAEKGRVAPKRVCEMVLQVLYALDTLHRANVVHGDVSLSNCLWRERDGGRDEVRLCDLGCAWVRSPCIVVSGAPAEPSEHRGTAYYTAPEIENEEAGDHRADLWSVGAMMYALMTMRDVDLGDPEEPLEIPPPVLLVPRIPRAISDVVMRALAPAEQRYLSAGDMIAAIRAALVMPMARRGVPLWASIAGMGLAAGLATFASLASLADAPPGIRPPELETPSAPVAGSDLPAMSDVGEAGSVAVGLLPAAMMAPADAPLVVPPPPEPTPPPSEPTPTAAPIPAKPAPAKSSPPRPVVVTWTTVERALKAKAAALRPCSSDEFIALGLRVANGRAKLESLDGDPAELPRDRCAADVVSELRFAKGDEITGVVGVRLPARTE